jgi:hypothetical protein
MFLVYRKLTTELDSLWHFNTQCTHWPEVHFVQVRFIDPKANRNEPLCQECAKLETKMFAYGSSKVRVN